MMKTLLVMTVGHSDVQLVLNDQRRKFDGNTCGTLHDEIKKRSWSVVDTPGKRNRDFVTIETVPGKDLTLCTPKLDAVLAYFGHQPPTSALILETTRQGTRDPRMAGEVLERRLRDRGVDQVIRVSFLAGREQLEDPSSDVDAVVRRSVVVKLSKAIRAQVEPLTQQDKVFVATTGGLAAANEVINELVRMHAVNGPSVIALEVPDRNRVEGEDRAVEEKFHPAAGIRARWQALSLIEKGNLLAAWGTVSHLEGAPGQGWTQFVKWLAQFASSLPFDPQLPSDGDLDVLKHVRMAVRAALRVELALRAGDIPRAVHGTVAFFEAALWDHLLDRFERTGQKQGPFEVLRLKEGKTAPTGKKLLRNEEPNDKEKRSCPFERLENGTYLFFEEGAGRFAKYYLKSEPLKALHDAVVNIKPLRNDVAHNEPTPELMAQARGEIVKQQLWSQEDRFLTQPLVQDVLQELGEPDPARLCDSLLSTVRNHLQNVD